MNKSVKKSIGYDRLSLSAKLPSGASLKFSINRGSERLAMAFSNDSKIAGEQLKAMSSWLKFRDEDETNIQRIERLESVLKMSNSGAEVIANLDKY
jgi:hypothetical protein